MGLRLPAGRGDFGDDWAACCAGLRQTAALHQQILDRLAVAPTPEGQLIDDLDTPARKIRTVLTDLELSGEIGRGPGGVIIKKR